MPRQSAELHKVVQLNLEPEARLRLLFRRERELLGKLADVRADLESARVAFSRANDLRANPRMELLRTRCAPPPRRQP